MTVYWVIAGVCGLGLLFFLAMFIGEALKVLRENYPEVEEPERSRLGISEREAQSNLRPRTGLTVAGQRPPTGRASAASTASPTTHRRGASNG